MDAANTVENIAQPAAKVVHKTVEATRPALEKLGLLKRKSLIRQPRFFIAAGIIAVFGMITKALFKPKSN